MSPEQVCANELDARTDLFSFGAVLYEMCTGTLPFRGESSGVIFSAILERSPVPPVRLNPNLPADLERIIDKCLEKDRNLRYQSTADIRADLQRLKRDTDSRKSAWIQSRDNGDWEGSGSSAVWSRWAVLFASCRGCGWGACEASNRSFESAGKCQPKDLTEHNWHS